MSSNGKAKPKRAAESWKSPGSPDGLDPVEQVAHGIVTERPDLMPSVDRIMQAPLDPDGRLQALTMFQVALETPGDPNRDPRVVLAQLLPEGEA